MRAPWIVPPQLIIGQTPKDIKDVEQRRAMAASSQLLISPNESVQVDRAAFEDYYKKSRAFQALVDKKHLIAQDKSAKTVHQALLKSPNDAVVPEDLKNDENQVAMSTEGTLDVQTMTKLKAIKK